MLAGLFDLFKYRSHAELLRGGGGEVARLGAMFGLQCGLEAGGLMSAISFQNIELQVKKVIGLMLQRLQSGIARSQPVCGDAALFFRQKPSETGGQAWAPEREPLPLAPGRRYERNDV